MTQRKTNDDRCGRLTRWVAWAHAGYFLVSGVWALVHRRSFEAITGPKVDY